jgi:hypothetical protein
MCTCSVRLAGCSKGGRQLHWSLSAMHVACCPLLGCVLLVSATVTPGFAHNLPH